MGLYINSFLKTHPILDIDTLKALVAFHTVTILFIGLYEHVIPLSFRLSIFIFWHFSGVF